jgi:hypothetical protein
MANLNQTAVRPTGNRDGRFVTYRAGLAATHVLPSIQGDLHFLHGSIIST